MTGKLTVALLVLFCLGQVYPATVQKSISIPLPPAVARSAIDDVIHQLNILISKIGQTIAELGHLIGVLESRVAEIANSLNLDDIVEDLWNQGVNIIQQAGVTVEQAATCIDQARVAVGELLEETVSGLEECLEVVGPVREQLQHQISEISGEGSALISSMSSGIARCYKENIWNQSKLLQCLRQLEEEAGNQTNDLVQRIGAALEANKEMINNLIEELNPCVQAVAERTNNSQQVILNNLGQCINEIN